MRYAKNNSIYKTIFNDFINDFLGTTLFNLRNLSIIFRFFIHTGLNRFHFRINGIIVGKNSKFIGKCIVSRYPQSRISFGEGCVFNSARNVNLIGVNRNCIISTQTRDAVISVGNNCGVSGATLSVFSKLTIGNNIKIGANVLITDSNWHPEDSRSGDPKPIQIGDNVWLGVNSVVLKGVTIGNNCLIGANCVVTSDIPDNSVVVGNPCKIVRILEM